MSFAALYARLCSLVWAAVDAKKRDPELYDHLRTEIDELRPVVADLMEGRRRRDA